MRTEAAADRRLRIGLAGWLAVAVIALDCFASLAMTRAAGMRNEGRRKAAGSRLWERTGE
jgi:hypothetical protein